ncbi:Electron transfer flavoprotein, alpha subunit [hydrothermal vent metagenome]|uniref:Electron transfer flavoprotein, alpha subunit n=1 Tax=hydrothermal vent metagenome TaxID=652676 RepID=A0A3B0W562_9ZZZZ
MSKILILAQHDGKTINQGTAKAITATQQIQGATVDVVIFADDTDSIANEASKLAGINTVHAVKTTNQNWKLATGIAGKFAQLAENYTHIFGPSTTFGKDVMPCVAALLGQNQISDIMQVIDANTFKRPIYAGNAIITVNSTHDKIVATIRTASFKTADMLSGSASIENHVIDSPQTDTKFITLQSGNQERPDLQTAAKVISGGRGVGSKDNFDIIYNLADKINAATGASRAAVDAGYVPNDMQVGQTGKIIAPDLYMAFGISGAIQHLTGIKDAGTIVAINKDADAPIFEVSDIGIVGDLFKIIPELMEKL